MNDDQGRYRLINLSKKSEDPEKIRLLREALGAEVVVSLNHAGPLGVLEMLALRSWFDERQRAIAGEL
jgi:hypothetical protein